MLDKLISFFFFLNTIYIITLGLSMNLQRGNALFVMGTVAHHVKLEEIYNLGTI